MAGITRKSGLRNIRGGSYHSFGMHASLNRGEYRGFPRNPELQLRWFLDAAGIVRQRRVAGARRPGGQLRRVGHLDRGRGAPRGREPRQLPARLDEARGLVA